jgi:hypothetical protein
MLGTAVRLVVAFMCLPFLIIPGINFIAGPVFVWCLVSAVRRIWRRPATGAATAE